MTRGRLPKKGLEDAILVAKARGAIMRFLQNRESVCDFMIMGNGNLVVVRVRKARFIRGTERTSRESLQEPTMGLRPFPASSIILEDYGFIPGMVSGDFSVSRIRHCGDLLGTGTPLKNSFIVVARTVRAVYPRKTGAALVKE